MKFNPHPNLEGFHAPFSASKSAWLRYDDEKALNVYSNMKASEMGTRLHDWAKNTIDLGIKQPRSKKTLYSYVNDAIGFKMGTEVVLQYSDRFFGTADSISFRKIRGRKELRIHDLKTGVIPGHMDQLLIYTALFCLEYKEKPRDIFIELRIYQEDDIIIFNPTVEDVVPVIDRIVSLDKLLAKADYEED